MIDSPADAKAYLGFALTTIPFDPNRVKQAYEMLDAELAKGTSPRDSIRKVADLIGFNDSRN